MDRSSTYCNTLTAHVYIYGVNRCTFAPIRTIVRPSVHSSELSHLFSSLSNRGITSICMERVVKKFNKRSVGWLMTNKSKGQHLSSTIPSQKQFSGTYLRTIFGKTTPPFRTLGIVDTIPTLHTYFSRSHQDFLGLARLMRRKMSKGHGNCFSVRDVGTIETAREMPSPITRQHQPRMLVLSYPPRSMSPCLGDFVVTAESLGTHLDRSWSSSALAWQPQLGRPSRQYGQYDLPLSLRSMDPFQAPYIQYHRKK